MSRRKAGYILLVSFLIVMSILNIKQQVTLNHEFNRAQADVKQAKAQAQQTTTMVDNPAKQIERVNQAQKNVQDWWEIVVNQKPNDYDNQLKQHFSQRALNTLNNSLSASVTFANRSHFDIKSVALMSHFDNLLEFLVVTQGQQVSEVYQVTYDLDLDQVTDIQRQVLKGAY
ncbi:hypothetical protein R55227_BLOPHJLP_01596 [Fructobacillus tropaeoli]|uniref:hypothetical protein n=1 Tax=Fructobacillus tropaeoli TaxID=709323 RepID=UPI002DAEC988|nr:hypothetical protein R55227_BLOPHJLP_01596 [Fructobacillus tropaeoli]